MKLRVKNRMIGRQMGSCCSQIWISFIQPRWEETGSGKIFGWKEQMLWNIAEIRYWLQTVTFIKRVRNFQEDSEWGEVPNKRPTRSSSELNVRSWAHLLEEEDILPRFEEA